MQTPDPVVNANAKLRIPLARPDVGEEEAFAVERCVLNGRLTQHELVERFEEEFSAAHGKQYGVACNSGTTALHLALALLEMDAADTIAMPTHTYVAVGNAAAYCGSRIIFCAGDPLIGNLRFNQLPEAARAGVDAVIVPHGFGSPVEITKSGNPSEVVIEDCAQAHYALFQGKRVGSFGDMAIFSFYANKIVTTGEGGMVITNDPGTAAKLKSLRANAVKERMRSDHYGLGYGYRMTELQAAIGLVQHSKHAKMLARRWELYNKLRAVLEPLHWTSLPEPPSTPWVFPFLTPFRDALREHLAQRGIETRSYFRPLHLMPHLAKFAVAQDEEALSALDGQVAMSNRGMYLGLYSGMTDGELNYVCEALASFKAQ
jgi:perosamine synthetase